MPKRPEAKAAAGVGAENARRRERFAVAFVGSCAGNATKAAKEAGYSARTAHAQGSRLLKNAEVAARIAELLAERGKVAGQAIAEAAERDRILSEIARDTKADLHARIRAMSELNKCEGRHSLAVALKGKLTLEQALEQVAQEETHG